jgi:hypothetical protein
LEKGLIVWNSATFLDHEFSCERDGRLYLEFDTKKDVFSICLMMANKLGCLDQPPFSGGLQSVSLLGASCSVHGRIQHKSAFFWYQSIDMHCIVFHVKFGCGLSISVLRNKATLYEKDGVQIRWVLKSSNFWTRLAQGRFLKVDFRVGLTRVVLRRELPSNSWLESREGGHLPFTFAQPYEKDWRVCQNLSDPDQTRFHAKR